MKDSKSKLLTPTHIYKPFNYPWAYDAWLLQQQIHWLPEEVPMGADINDWKNVLSVEEKNLLTQIFRFFTQADIEVADCYMTKYSNVFKPIEVKMMLTAFSNMETIHVAAYSHLIDTIGMPESTYSEFMKYKEMKDKFDYMQNFNVDSLRDIAKTMAVFGAFTEGLQLFASFAMLLNFPRYNKMKGMGQIITWSVRDESLHAESIIRLFRTFIEEHHEIWDDELKKELYDACREIVTHEEAFIDLAFKMGGIEGMTATDIKQYIRFIADRRLLQLGLKPNYGVKENPLPWIDEILNAPELANFFEQRVTEYAKASTTGVWEDIDDIKQITIYGQEGCPWCVKACDLLDNYSIPYYYVDLTNDWEKKKALYKEFDTISVPMITTNGKFVGGYLALEKLLKE
jgi:ribonucleoside-diphosphate reductase beta chain